MNQRSDHMRGPCNARLAGALLIVAMASAWGAGVASGGTSTPKEWPTTPLDPVKLELVMQIVATCSSPEEIGGSTHSKDGIRDSVWPIIGGRFVGKGIRGVVVPGGGDFPVVRPDGVVVVDALYRLKTDDGITIILHDFGIAYPGKTSSEERYRLTPEFIAPAGKYDWLNKNIFIATLSDVPKGMELAKGPNENDRLIQVYRVD